MRVIDCDNQHSVLCLYGLARGGIIVIISLPSGHQSGLVVSLFFYRVLFCWEGGFRFVFGGSCWGWCIVGYYDQEEEVGVTRFSAVCRLEKRARNETGRYCMVLRKGLDRYRGRWDSAAVCKIPSVGRGMITHPYLQAITRVPVEVSVVGVEVSEALVMLILPFDGFEPIQHLFPFPGNT